MLQWMGGSRRKVTTSRKSTHKRQKQYFEQRKRQQQQTAGLESYSDGKRSCNLQCEYSRSLDILSLENVSTVAQEHKTGCVTVKESRREHKLIGPSRGIHDQVGLGAARDNSEHEDFTLDNEDAVPSQVILTSSGISVDHSEIDEEWTPSSYVTEAEYPEREKAITPNWLNFSMEVDSNCGIRILAPQSYRVSVHLPNGNENLVGTLNKLDSSKLSMSHQISVIDLLGDGGANTNAEENSLHKQEAHVAFSVEGLGQVEAETPVHSPKIPGRSFLDCYSPPKKTGRVPVTSRHLDYGFHDLGSGLDIDFSPHGSTMDQPFCTRNVMNVSGDPNLKFMNFRRPSPYNWNSCDVLGVSGNDELLYYNRDSSRNVWNEAQEEQSIPRFLQGPSFLEDGIDDLGEYKSFCRNLDQRDSFDDCFHTKNLWTQDLNFQSWDLNKKRSNIKRPTTYNVKASPGPYPKHSTMEDLDGIRMSDMRWRSTIEINNDVKDVVDNSETEESLSLRSEESCSSAAVRGDATKKS